MCIRDRIKSAIEKGLTESQLVELINNNISAEKMKAVSYTHLYSDAPAVGELTVEKKGEVLDGFKGGLLASSYEKEFVYREGSLAGAKFKVYAAEDIYTADNQKDADGNRIKSVSYTHLDVYKRQYMEQFREPPTEMKHPLPNVKGD